MGTPKLLSASLNTLTGGEDATGILYPKGLTIYGRWTEVIPSVDTDGGVICYFGK